MGITGKLISSYYVMFNVQHEKSKEVFWLEINFVVFFYEYLFLYINLVFKFNYI